MNQLNHYSYNELKTMARDMGIKNRRSKKLLVADMGVAIQEYEEYKKHTVDKWTKIGQLGNTGKEGTTYLVRSAKNKEYAMKTFKSNKSSNTLRREAELQQIAGKTGVSPKVIEYDTVSKYIVMEKMDQHLFHLLKKQKGRLYKYQQLRIISIFKKLDEIRIFHGDANILNYMVKDKIIYIIDYGFARHIDKTLIKKLGTNQPNMTIMLLGFILKLKEFGIPEDSYKYLLKYLKK